MSCFSARSMIFFSKDRLRTAPVGLLGLLTRSVRLGSAKRQGRIVPYFKMMSLVFCRIIPVSSSMSGIQLFLR